MTRAEIESAFREALKAWPKDRGEPAMNYEAKDCIVSVTERLLREQKRDIYLQLLNQFSLCAIDQETLRMLLPQFTESEKP